LLNRDEVNAFVGLSYIAGRLLILSPDEDAFWIFVSLMDTYLRPWFSVNTIQMEVDASLFSKALETNDGQVAKKLYTELGISQTDVCRPWCVCFRFSAFVIPLTKFTTTPGSLLYSRNRYLSNTSIESGTSSYMKVINDYLSPIMCLHLVLQRRRVSLSRRSRSCSMLSPTAPSI
jgi:hypothetical protein